MTESVALAPSPRSSRLEKGEEEAGQGAGGGGTSMCNGSLESRVPLQRPGNADQAWPAQSSGYRATERFSAFAASTCVLVLSDIDFIT